MQNGSFSGRDSIDKQLPPPFSADNLSRRASQNTAFLEEVPDLRERRLASRGVVIEYGVQGIKNDHAGATSATIACQRDESVICLNVPATYRSSMLPTPEASSDGRSVACSPGTDEVQPASGSEGVRIVEASVRADIPRCRVLATRDAHSHSPLIVMACSRQILRLGGFVGDGASPLKAQAGVDQTCTMSRRHLLMPVPAVMPPLPRRACPSNGYAAVPERIGTRWDRRLSNSR